MLFSGVQQNDSVIRVCVCVCVSLCMGFPGGSDGKESVCNAGDTGSIPGWGISPGEGNGNPLQYAWMENPMDRGAWLAAVPLRGWNFNTLMAEAGGDTIQSIE